MSLFAALLIAGPPALAGTQHPSHPYLTTLRLVAGSGVTAEGSRWASDSRYAEGGDLERTRGRVTGTHQQQLFTTERAGRFGYRLPVVPGWYRVTMHMSDLYQNKPGRQVFNVIANGVTMVHHLDLAATAGLLRAYTVSIDVRVPTSRLDLRFVPLRLRAAVSSLSVTGLRNLARPPGRQAPLPGPVSSIPVAAPAPVKAPSPADVVTPEMFGALGNGVTDDTAALERTFAGADGRTVELPAGHVYAHSSVLTLATPGLHVSGPGELLATDEQESSVWIEADDVVIDGGVLIKTAHTTQRWSTWDQMGIRIDGHTGDTLRDVTVDGSAAAGVYLGGSTTHFLLDHVTVENTRADGIHMTQGSNDGQVIDPTVINSGDDGIAIVSYLADGSQCHNITVTSPTVLGTSGGRGLSVLGGSDITETNIDIERSSAAAVYIGAEGNPWYTYAASDVTVSGGRIVAANTDPTIDHGAVVVLSGESDAVPANITISSLTITDTRATASRDIGVITYGTPPTAVSFSHLAITGGPASAYSGNTPQSAYQLRHIVQNGVLLPDAG